MKLIKNPDCLRRFRRFIITLLIIFLLFVIIGIFLNFYYENTVKRIIISELNKRLNTEIVVNDIDKDIQFSLFKSFPYASVSFCNVKVLDAIKTKKNKGNLLEASRLSLQFNILDLLFKKYQIKRILAEKGKVSIKIYNDGSDNYHFWKPSTDKKSSFALDLKKILLKEMAISYVDYKFQQDFKVKANDIILKGNFSDNDYTLNIDGKLFVYKIKQEGSVFLAGQNTTVDVTLYVSNNEKYVSFSEGGISLGKMLFDITGKISYVSSPNYMDLHIEGKKIKLQSFFDILPESYKSTFNDYKFSGEAGFDAYIKGCAGEKSNPLFSVSFTIKDGDISQKKNDITLSHVNFSADYNNGEGHNLVSSKLSVRDFNSKLNDGSISGSLIITNFVRPFIDLKLNADLDLKDVFLFIRADTVESASGKLVIKTDINGTIDRPDGFTVKDFIASKSTGTLDVIKAEIILKGGQHKFSNINGSFRFNNNDIETDEFDALYRSSDFSLKGTFKNIIPYLFIDDQSLMISASLNSKNIDMGQILENTNNKHSRDYKMNLPGNVDFSLIVNIGKFTFNKFSATNISGKVSLKNQQFVANDISLQAMDGKIKFDGLIDGTTKDKLLMSCDASVQNVNIKKLFAEMGNFGQKSLEDKNLDGTLTSKIQFASVWSNTLTVEKPTIYARADITVSNGALINYEPLKGLSKYLKNRDLKYVSFDTLKNTIEIKNQVINIPQMSINSSAIDFQVNGTHDFDNKIDYQLNVLISQLQNTGKDRNDQIEDIGQITDDGLHKEKYFFRITGTVDNPVYHMLDKEGYKTYMKTNLKQEKESLKQILNREFGWFKKDTAIKKDADKKQKENSFDFNVVWDEDTIK